MSPRRRDSLLAAVALAALAAGCGPKTLKMRMTLSETRANQLEQSLQNAEVAMMAVDPKRAEESLETARELAKDEDLPLYPEYLMLTDRLAADEKRLPSVRKARERRDLETAVAKQRAALVEPLAAWKKAFAVAEARAVTGAQVEEARDAENTLRGVLAAGASLIERDVGYTAFAAEVRGQLERAAAVVVLAEARAKFVEGPAEHKSKAAAALKAARSAKKPEAKREAGGDAVEALQRCIDGSVAALVAQPALARAPIQVDSIPSTADSVLGWCRGQLAEATRLAASSKTKPNGKRR